MGLVRYVVLLLWLTVAISAPPVTEKKKSDSEHDGEKDSEVKENLEDYMEYHRYLKEVVAALESDPEFREKLEKADYVDIRSGKIAHELDFVNHNVRTKLDEIKRGELERLRHLMAQQYELANNIDTAHIKVSPNTDHLDHNNPHTFEIDDLKKLIQKTTMDLEEADKKRRSDFKEYEMQKEFEKQQKLQGMDEEHRKTYEKEIHDKEEKHKKHQPLHHPGSRQQLEEVWEKQDHMDSQQFDPKVFFMLHDVDSNGVWDQNEVKALFLKELDKMYENGAPEDDMRERQEEMERMREHVFHESDTNKDGFISYEEFLVQTRRAEFEKDQGWKSIDEQEIYSPQEYQEFEKHRLEEVQKLIQQGLIPPQPIYNPGIPPYQQYPHGGQVQHPPNGQYDQQYHPNAIPQQQQYHPNAIPQQYHPNAIPQQQQYHPNAVPQGNNQFQNNPQGQGQQYQQNIPQQNQQFQQNAPQQNQQFQQNVPQQNQQFQQNVPQQNQQYQQNHQNQPNVPAQGQQNVQNPAPHGQQNPQNVPIQNAKQDVNQPNSIHNTADKQEMKHSDNAASMHN